MQATVKKVTKVETFDNDYGEITYFKYHMVGTDGNSFNIKSDDNEFKVGQTVEIK
jgi:hypothetical protein